MNLSHFACLILVLTGCSTVPIPPPQVNGPAIVITRDTGFVGGGCDVRISVDGVRVATLQPGQSHVQNVKRGERRVTAEIGSLMCSDVRMNRIVNVVDEPKRFRLSIAGGSMQIFFEED